MTAEVPWLASRSGTRLAPPLPPEVESADTRRTDRDENAW